MRHDSGWDREYDAGHAKRLVEEMAAKHAVPQEYLASFARADTLNVPARPPKPRTGTLALMLVPRHLFSPLAYQSAVRAPWGIDHRSFLRRHPPCGSVAV